MKNYSKKDWNTDLDMAKKTTTQSKLKAGIFIDNANFFYAQKNAGWKVDIAKFKKLIKKELDVQFTHYHIAIPARWDKSYAQTQKYIGILKKQSTIYSKPLKYIRAQNTTVKKGDVDLEVALDVVRHIDDLGVFVVISGDSDYVELRKYVLEKKKKIVFVSFRQNMAWEIKRGKYILFDDIRGYVELGTKTPGYYPGRLLLSILYTKNPKKSTPSDGAR